MKKLLLVRHAKSSWAHEGQADFDRPLNDRGKADAPMMAKRLLDKKITIDLFVSSPAKRAKKTALKFMKEYKADEKDLLLIPHLYEADTQNFLNVVETIDDKFETVALFSHNPGITYFANTLTSAYIDNMPTCSVFAVNIDTDKWALFKDAKKDFWFFDMPKAGAD